MALVPCKTLPDPKEFEIRMRNIASMNDIEQRHMDADDLIANMLSLLGYEDGIRIYNDMGKYYV